MGNLSYTSADTGFHGLAGHRMEGKIANDT
jgi:hypothetical protein